MCRCTAIVITEIVPREVFSVGRGNSQKIELGFEETELVILAYFSTVTHSPVRVPGAKGNMRLRGSLSSPWAVRFPDYLPSALPQNAESNDFSWRIPGFLLWTSARRGDSNNTSGVNISTWLKRKMWNNKSTFKWMWWIKGKTEASKPWCWIGGNRIG
jgi:hypothetical protein